MLQAEQDIVADILRRVRDAVPDVAPDTVRAIEAAVRLDWGGDRPYVSKHGEVGRQVILHRNLAIREQYARNEPFPLLARRWGLSERRVRQIVDA